VRHAKPNLGGFVVKIAGFFDESGTFDYEPKVFCVAGYYLEAERVAAMESAWSAVLLEHKITCFHMVDCAQGTGEFKNLPGGAQERTDIQTKLIALIKQYTIEGIAIVTQAAMFDPSDDPYTKSVDLAVQMIKGIEASHQVTGLIALWFEAGHKSQNGASRRIASMLSETMSVGFIGKAATPLLQAADLLAWHTLKNARERSNGRSRMRADYRSLLEHLHTVVFLDCARPDPISYLEIWPMTRRTSHETKQIVGEWPATYMIEDSNPRPIFLVKNIVRYAAGPTDTVHVYVEDEFGLSFDENRLYAAISGLIEAASIFQNDNGPKFVAESIQIELEDAEKTMIKLTLPTGLPVYFLLQKSALLAFAKSYSQSQYRRDCIVYWLRLWAPRSLSSNVDVIRCLTDSLPSSAHCADSGRVAHQFRLVLTRAPVLIASP
jgi:Protein of unknown function (DUF3800)